MVFPNSLTNRQKDDEQTINNPEDDMVTVDLNRSESNSEKKPVIRKPKHRNKYLCRLMFIFAVIIVILISADMLNEKYHLIRRMQYLHSNTSEPLQKNQFNEKILKGNYIEQYLNDMEICKVKQTMEYCCHIFRNSDLNDLIQFCTVNIVLDSLVAYEESLRRKRAANNFVLYYKDDKPQNHLHNSNAGRNNPQYYQEPVQREAVPMNLEIPNHDQSIYWNNQPVVNHQPQTTDQLQNLGQLNRIWKPDDIVIQPDIEEIPQEPNSNIHFVPINPDHFEINAQPENIQKEASQNFVYAYNPDGVLVKILLPPEPEPPVLMQQPSMYFHQPAFEEVFNHENSDSIRLSKDQLHQPHNGIFFDYNSEPVLESEVKKIERGDVTGARVKASIKTPIYAIPEPPFRRKDDKTGDDLLGIQSIFVGNPRHYSTIPTSTLKTLNQQNRDKFLYEHDINDESHDYYDFDNDEHANSKIEASQTKQMDQLRIDLFKLDNTIENDTSKLDKSSTKTPIIIQPIKTDDLDQGITTKSLIQINLEQSELSDSLQNDENSKTSQGMEKDEDIKSRINPMEIIEINRISADNFGKEVSTTEFDSVTSENTENPDNQSKTETLPDTNSEYNEHTDSTPNESAEIQGSSFERNITSLIANQDKLRNKTIEFMKKQKVENYKIIKAPSENHTIVELPMSANMNYIKILDLINSFSRNKSMLNLDSEDILQRNSTSASSKIKQEVDLASRNDSSLKNEENNRSREPCFYSHIPAASSSLFSSYPLSQSRLTIVNPPVFMSPFMHPYPGFFTNQGPILPPFASNMYNPVIRTSSDPNCLPVPPIAHTMLGVSEGSETNLQNLMEDFPIGNNNKSRSSEPTLDCPDGELPCLDNSECIPKKDFCDGEVHCQDSSDEISCSCSDRIGKFRNCDGYCDCPNCEDEEGCFGCEKDEFACDDWNRYRPSTCIPMSQRCDNIQQCEMTGKDEMDCTILTDTLGNFPLSKISNSVGFLHRNYKGQWYPTCFGTELWAMQVCQVEAGPSSIVPKSHMTLTSSQYDGNYINILPNHEVSLVNTCVEDRAAFVECPSIYCGIRFLTDNPYRSQRLDTSVEDMISQFERNQRRQWIQENNLEEERARNLNGDSAEVLKYTESNMEEGTTPGTDNDSEMVKESRVVGGRASQPAAWPWLVSIYKNGVFFCGGVLIHESWVMTASHCVDNFWNHYYEIQAGVLRRFSFSPMDQRRYAKMIISNEFYQHSILRHDIALIKLSDPLRFNRYVRPICLPSEATAGVDFLKGPKPGTICTTVGWGATIEHGSDPDQMREVEVPILDSCKHKEDSTNYEICAGFAEGGKDACQGDSGGPLMCRNPNDPNQWYLAGIVSHGQGCARPNEPGVYTKVSYYLGWINENMRENKQATSLPLQECPGYVCKGTKRCIRRSRQCDKFVDCLLGDDEENCDHIQVDFYGQARNKKNSTNKFGLFNEIMEYVLPQHGPSLIDTYLGAALTNHPRSVTNITNKATRKIKRANPSGNSTNNATFTFPDFVCTKYLQTVRMEYVCDRDKNCHDGTDEYNCTDVDYLVNEDPLSLCDGIVDTKDASDEDCDFCGKDEFYCMDSQRCIDVALRCDGKFDCQLGEDEMDCIALSMTNSIDMDIDGRSALFSTGFLYQRIGNDWSEYCLMANETKDVPRLAENTCSYLGFAGYLIYSDMKYDKPKGNCVAKVFISCTDVIIRPTFYRQKIKYVRTVYHFPWIAVIYSNGIYKCMGAILARNWIITSKHCSQDLFKLDKNHVVAAVGKGKLNLYANGPYEQNHRVIRSLIINYTDIMLLQLENLVTINRYVQVIQTNTSTSGTFRREKCYAVGLDNDNGYRVRFFQLKVVLNECGIGKRCYKWTHFNPNKTKTCNSVRNWSGPIICDSRNGYYVASVFHERLGHCGFTDFIFYDNIHLYKNDIVNAMKKAMSVQVDMNTLVPTNNRCQSGIPVLQRELCDGFKDCQDGSDETPEVCYKVELECDLSNNCVCPYNEFQCPGTKICRPKSSYCDRIEDCPGGEDEPDICSCRNYLNLTSPWEICNGELNCKDRTDEDIDLCGCRKGYFLCEKSKKCVPQSMVCDDHIDCPDKEDELTCLKFRNSYNLRMENTKYQAGDVLRRKAGIWYQGCFRTNYTQLELKQYCRILGYSGTAAYQIKYTDSKNRKLTPLRVRFDTFPIIWLRRDPGNKFKIQYRNGIFKYTQFYEDSRCRRLLLLCM